MGERAFSMPLKTIPMSIREMLEADWPSVSRIYQLGMDTNNATFETVCPAWEAFNSSHTMDCRFVALRDDALIAWAALSLVSKRSVYCGVAEVSIYVDDANNGKGVGTFLLNYLIEKSEHAGYWTLQSNIMSGNTASIRLHGKCGFREVGYRERIGKDRFGIWRDTILMERRKR